MDDKNKEMNLQKRLAWDRRVIATVFPICGLVFTLLGIEAVKLDKETCFFSGMYNSRLVFYQATKKTAVKNPIDSFWQEVLTGKGNFIIDYKKALTLEPGAVCYADGNPVEQKQLIAWLQAYRPKSLAYTSAPAQMR